MRRILIIDNYDSFTYNLVQCVGSLLSETDSHIRVERNDQISVEEILDYRPDRLIISPGPGRPEDAGICEVLIARGSGMFPILGVCLGHQCIARVFGASVVRAGRVVHGKSSMIAHDGSELFQDLDSPFEAGRYHSLVVDGKTVKYPLMVSATGPEGEVMAVRHVHHPTYGVQFHPESVLTPAGIRILENFLRG